MGPLLFLIFINDLPTLFENCEYLLFADDLKIFKVISEPNDSHCLQRNLTIVNKWCKANGMSLNIEKCAIISFTKRNVIELFDYEIDSIKLKRVELIKDLGIIFDQRMSFKPHIDKIVSSGYSILGFVKRRAKEFNDPHITKSLYCSLVQSSLEYASVIWAPYYQIDSKRIESVQKQFLLFALKPLGFQGFHLPSYESRLLLLNMTTLENRRELASVLFAFDILRGNIKIKNLSDRIKLKVNNYALRNRRLLIEDLHCNNFVFNDTISKSIRIFNKYSDFYDCNISRDTFKKRVSQKFKTLFNS